MEQDIAKNFPKTVIEFQEKFATEAQCESYLFEIKWLDGFKCSKCGHDEYWKTDKGLYVCKKCEHQHSLKSGTIMHKSKKPLKLWFTAIWLFVTSKNGISAKELERQLGISYPTAWLWLQKLRCSSINPKRSELSETVEVDEFYLGGKEKGKQGRGAEDKFKVVIAVEKIKNPQTCVEYLGRIRLKEVESCNMENLTEFVNENISIQAQIKTDMWSGYKNLKNIGYSHQAEKIKDYNLDFKYLHQIVALIKRWVLGTFHGRLSKKHIQKYLEEFTFRFNRRHYNIGYRFKRLLEFSVIAKPLTYSDIIEKLETS